MTRYFLGTDTGATKSHALIADEQGRAAGFGVGGPGNPQQTGFDNLTRLLDELLTQTIAQAGIVREQIAGAGFGIAGYDWPSQRERFSQAVTTLGLNAPIEFANDAVVGLLAGVSAGWGVAVVAGTSCNCRGRDRQGREGRVTGFGPLMGENGGATELVAQAVRAVVFEWTKRGPATRLTQAFMALTGAQSAAELIEGVTTEQVKIGAEAARLVFQLATEGDMVALEAIRWCGHELAEMANGVIRQLNLESQEFEVALVGSLFAGGPLLIDPLREAIHAIAPRARLVKLNAPPVIGGVLLGMERAGVNGWVVRDQLIETTKLLCHQG